VSEREGAGGRDEAEWQRGDRVAERRQSGREEAERRQRGGREEAERRQREGLEEVLRRFGGREICSVTQDIGTQIWRARAREQKRDSEGARERQRGREGGVVTPL